VQYDQFVLKVLINFNQPAKGFHSAGGNAVGRSSAVNLDTVQFGCGGKQYIVH